MLDVTVFYIEEETHAEIKGNMRQPFVGLWGTTLSISSDSNPEVDLIFNPVVVSSINNGCGVTGYYSREQSLYTSAQVVSFINNASGVSGFHAKDCNGFVVLESKTLGQLSSITVSSGNTVLGISAGTSNGTDQVQVVVPVDVNITEIQPGIFAVSFPVNRHDFVIHRSYFVRMSDGIATTVKRFSVLNNVNSATVNFVG